MHRNALELFEKFATPYIKEGMSVLEIGPDAHPSSAHKCVTTKDLTWSTLDIANNDNLTYPNQKEYHFNIPDETFDLVFSINVTEHVREIWTWYKELSRVCKKGGLVISINPLSWPYHEYPVDCWRIFPEGMRALCESASLETLESFCASMEVEEFALKKHAKEIITPEGALILDNSLPEKLKRLGIRHLTPGVGNPSSLFKTKLKRVIGWPIVVAFDTFTAAQKKS